MAQEPTVLQTSPANYATNVSTDSQIRVEFNTDLDSLHIQTNVYLTDTMGVRVPGRITYQRRKLEFQPEQILAPGTSYQLVLVGDSDLKDGVVNGIRGITGVPMKGLYSLQFTTDSRTAIPAPIPRTPMNGTIIRAIPVFLWEPLDDASWYEFRLSTSNTFDVLVFPATEPHRRFFGTSLTPNIQLNDGIYYWAVRGIRADGVAGEWSIVSQFNLDTLVPGKISEEDAYPVEVIYEPFDTDIEVIASYPTNELALVPLTAKALWFRVLGEIDISLLDVDSIRLVGTHVTDDATEESHGSVKGRVIIVKGENDDSSYLVFVPEVPADALVTVTATTDIAVSGGLKETDIVLVDAANTTFYPVYVEADEETDNTYRISGSFPDGVYQLIITKAGYSFNMPTVTIASASSAAVVVTVE